MNITRKIQTTETNFEVTSTTHLVVDINSFRFILDQQISHRISIQRRTGNEIFETIDEIDIETVVDIHIVEDLKITALNWYFKNVEVVKNIELSR